MKKKILQLFQQKLWKKAHVFQLLQPILQNNIFLSSFSFSSQIGLPVTKGYWHKMCQTYFTMSSGDIMKCITKLEAYSNIEFGHSRYSLQWPLKHYISLSQNLNVHLKKMLKLIMHHSNKMNQERWEEKGKRLVGFLVEARNKQRLLYLMIRMRIMCNGFLKVVN